MVANMRGPCTGSGASVSLCVSEDRLEVQDSVGPRSSAAFRTGLQGLRHCSVATDFHCALESRALGPPVLPLSSAAPCIHNGCALELLHDFSSHSCIGNSHLLPSIECSFRSLGHPATLACVPSMGILSPTCPNLLSCAQCLASPQILDSLSVLYEPLGILPVSQEPQVRHMSEERQLGWHLPQQPMFGYRI